MFLIGLWLDLQVTLVSILARSDQECLLSELKTLREEAQATVTVSSKPELQGVCGHLQNVRCPRCFNATICWKELHTLTAILRECAKGSTSTMSLELSANKAACKVLMFM